MPKWISNTGSGSGTHLYPHTSVDVNPNATGSGHAVGPAYCGTDGNNETVFAPDDGSTLSGFTVEPGEPATSWTWTNPCPDCADLIKTGALTDPDWQKRFREEVLNDA